MKLIILTQYFPPEVGAPQNRLFELAVRLLKSGVEIEVMTAMPNYPQMVIHEAYRGKRYVYEEMEGIRVHRSRISVPASRSVPARLLNYFSFVWTSYFVGKRKLSNADFLLVESPPLFLGMSARRLAKRKKAKMIFNVSDLWPESAEKLGIVTNRMFLKMAYRLEAGLYRDAALVTGQTQGIVESIRSRFPQKKVYWLPNGVDLNYYNPAKYDRSWRMAQQFSEKDILLLYAGIIGHAQGLEIILKAADALRSHPHLKFILLGSGPEKEGLMAKAEEMKLENVMFKDAVTKKEMPAIIASCDIALIPLKKLELFKGAIPSKIFESLAMKKPVLLGVEGEAKTQFIDEGKAGLAFEPENAEDLVSKILMMTADTAAIETYGSNALKYVATHFNREKIAADFLNFLNTELSYEKVPQ
jgi:glycosyltransferase involved in cell wall biosynthesis